MGRTYMISVKVSDKKWASRGRISKKETGDPHMPTDAQVEAGAAASLGGVAADYTTFRTTNTTEQARLDAGDEFVATLDGSNDVTSVSFATEDAKQWIEITTDVTDDEMKLNDDDTYDTLNVTAKIYEDDKTTLDTSYNGTITICGLNTANKSTPLKLVFASGVKTWQMKPKHRGDYVFPTSKIRVFCEKDPSVEFRVKTQVKINVFSQP
ncbi:MAG: hypothetical protein V3V00_15945 [Saprospiraceae bacterium]